MDRDRVDRIIRSWIWVLIPILTFGFATPLVIGLAAILRRSGRQGWFALGYAVVVAAELLVVQVSGPISNLFWVGVALTLPVGFVHALMIRRWAWDIERVREPADAPSTPAY